ncbi:hypothetical protein C8Q73DRAFT_690085 [Cubamyces lactineus]|nr:hypothetical protein C8Q73DRAFT_690085 [Cubamyces lactineus]
MQFYTPSLRAVLVFALGLAAVQARALPEPAASQSSSVAVSQSQSSSAVASVTFSSSECPGFRGRFNGHRIRGASVKTLLTSTRPNRCQCQRAASFFGHLAVKIYGEALYRYPCRCLRENLGLCC